MKTPFLRFLSAFKIKVNSTHYNSIVQSQTKDRAKKYNSAIKARVRKHT